MNRQHILGFAFILIVTSSLICYSVGPKNDQERKIAITDYIHSTSYSNALTKNTRKSSKNLELKQDLQSPAELQKTPYPY